MYYPNYCFNIQSKLLYQLNGKIIALTFMKYYYFWYINQPEIIAYGLWKIIISNTQSKLLYQLFWKIIISTFIKNIVSTFMKKYCINFYEKILYQLLWKNIVSTFMKNYYFKYPIQIIISNTQSKLIASTFMKNYYFKYPIQIIISSLWKIIVST
jgi:hypothetical protein